MSDAPRNLSQRVKTARGRKTSSTRWLQRQLNDPYVQQAKRDGYRSRAAYKLTELDDKFKLLGKGKTVVDLGAAPGGWTQVAVQRCGENRVVAIDVLEMPAVTGAIVLRGDFMDEATPAMLHGYFPDGVDVVLSDLAPNTVGHTMTDHLRIMAVVEAAAAFALEVLKPGGAFVTKVWQGGTEHGLLKELKLSFSSVKHAKPKASRADSAETFLVATGFRKR